MTAYRNGPGTLRFPLGHPLPLDLIGRVVVLLVAQRAGPSDPAPPEGRIA